jgi:hypothetical protein
MKAIYEMSRKEFDIAVTNTNGKGEYKLLIELIDNTVSKLGRTNNSIEILKKVLSSIETVPGFAENHYYKKKGIRSIFSKYAPREIIKQGKKLEIIYNGQKLNTNFLVNLLNSQMNS